MWAYLFSAHFDFKFLSFCYSDFFILTLHPKLSVRMFFEINDNRAAFEQIFFYLFVFFMLFYFVNSNKNITHTHTHTHTHTTYPLFTSNISQSFARVIYKERGCKKFFVLVASNCVHVFKIILLFSYSRIYIREYIDSTSLSKGFSVIPLLSIYSFCT